VTSIPSKKQDELKRLFYKWKVRFDSALDPVILADKNCIITEANSKAAEFFETHNSKMLGTNCYRLFYGKNVNPFSQKK